MLFRNSKKIQIVYLFYTMFFTPCYDTESLFLSPIFSISSYWMVLYLVIRTNAPTQPRAKCDVRVNGLSAYDLCKMIVEFQH